MSSLPVACLIFAIKELFHETLSRSSYTENFMLNKLFTENSHGLITNKIAEHNRRSYLGKLKIV